jgi:hypothetical protein
LKTSFFISVASTRRHASADFLQHRKILNSPRLKSREALATWAYRKRSTRHGVLKRALNGKPTLLLFRSVSAAPNVIGNDLA